jgi:hypothetical protein
VYLPGGARPALVHTSLDPAVTRDYFAHFWREDAPMLELVRRRAARGARAHGLRRA